MKTVPMFTPLAIGRGSGGSAGPLTSREAIIFSGPPIAASIVSATNLRSIA
jgi:hypothetical protein